MSIYDLVSIYNERIVRTSQKDLTLKSLIVLICLKIILENVKFSGRGNVDLHL